MVSNWNIILLEIPENKCLNILLLQVLEWVGYFVV